MVNCDKHRKILRVSHIQVDSLSQIILIEDSLVKPVTYSQIHGLANVPVPEAKRIFISALLPAILIAKHHITENQTQLHELSTKKNWTTEDSAFYHLMKQVYKVSDLESLLSRLTTLPNSIVLGQAALESGWGQSRFFREANNIFGMWSYNEKEPRLRASLKRENGHIHVRVYDDFSQSVDDYFKTLATARAYRSLREALQETSEVDKLIPHLKYYSERRMEYVNQLKKVIDQNNLTQYDHYRIDPEYLVAP